MKLKFLIFIVIGMLCGFVHGQTKNYAVIAGHLSEKPQFDPLYAVLPYMGTVKGKENHKAIDLDDNNRFSIKIPIEDLEAVGLFISKTLPSVIVQPGDSIYLDINNSSLKIRAVATYSGKGAEKNRLLAQVIDYMESPFYWYNDFTKGIEMADNKGSIYRKGADYCRQRTLAFFSEDIHGLSSTEAQAYIKGVIDYKWASDLLSYPQKRNRSIYKEDEVKTQIVEDAYPEYPESYFTFLDSVEVSNDLLLSYSDYRYFIEDYLAYGIIEDLKMKGELEDGKNSYGNSKSSLMAIKNDPGRMIEQAEKKLSGRTKYYTQTLLLLNWIINTENFEEIRPVYHSFLEKCTVPYYIDQVKTQYETYVKMGKGEMAKSFDLANGKGTTTSLRDLKGKVVLLEFTFYDCSWCKVELPYLKKMEQELKGKDFQVVYITIDEKDEKFKLLKEEILQKGPKNAMLLQDKGRKVADAYGVVGYPRFFLIDRDGRVISSNAKRPSTSYDEDFKERQGGLKDDILEIL